MLTAEDKEEIKRLIGEVIAGSAPSSSESIADVTARATEMFGSRERALRWLRTPVPALGDQTPLSLLNTPEGAARVLNTLGQIEHGVW